MIVDDKKDLAWCFVCNSGGDIFALTEKLENCSFVEALRFLGEKLGIEVGMKTISPELKKKKASEKDAIYEALEAASVFFIQQLEQSEQAKKVLAERKMSEELLRKFAVGYAPAEGKLLEKTLVNEGFSRALLEKAGLIKKTSSEGHQDTFRNRLMFPIRNATGRICAFGGRYIGSYENAPKYLNSPEHPAYKKSEILYGYWEAKEALKQEKKAILVEGYFDVLACHAVGIQQVVAVSGVAFTPQHAKLLRRSVDVVSLCFDIDDAGQMAARKAAAIALRAGLQIELVQIPGGKDPDEAVREDREAFLAAIREPKTGIEAFVDRSLLHRSPEHLEDKKQILDEVLPMVAALPREIERDHYLQLLAAKLFTTGDILQKELEHKGQLFLPEQTTKREESIMSSVEYFFGLLGVVPEYFEEVKEHFFVDFLPPKEKKLYKALLTSYNEQGLLSLEKAREHLTPEEQEWWTVRCLYAEERLQHFSDLLKKEELLGALSKLNRMLLKKRQEELMHILQKEPERAEELLPELNEMNKLLQKITYG